MKRQRAYIVAVVLQRLIDRFNLRDAADAHKWVMAARQPDGVQAFHEVRNTDGEIEIARFYTECDPFPLLGDAIHVALPIAPSDPKVIPGQPVEFTRQPFKRREIA